MKGSISFGLRGIVFKILFWQKNQNPQNQNIFILGWLETIFFVLVLIFLLVQRVNICWNSAGGKYKTPLRIFWKNPALLNNSEECTYVTLWSCSDVGSGGSLRWPCDNIRCSSAKEANVIVSIHCSVTSIMAWITSKKTQSNFNSWGRVRWSLCMPNLIYIFHKGLRSSIAFLSDNAMEQDKWGEMEERNIHNPSFPTGICFSKNETQGTCIKLTWDVFNQNKAKSQHFG